MTNRPVPNSPTSVRQQAANEKNAQLSTGPRTAAGIEACKHNRISHGLASTLTVLPCEAQSAFDELHAELTREHLPSGPTETTLVTQIAAAIWKLRRLGSIEQSVFALMLQTPEAGSVATAFDQIALDLTNNCKTGNALGLLMRYQASLNRQFLQSLKELRTLQDRRRAAQNETDKANVLHRIAGNTERTHSQKRALELLTADPDIVMHYANAEELVFPPDPLPATAAA
ncbi:MAG TPA: hypothetical protein VMZ52_19510 [Bryobacteraceae bacterium]|nr:hypothetical protein [Bryobacteraceae bacterium]